MDQTDGWIDAVEFPAHKHDVIDVAADAGAPQDLIERLQATSQEQYESRSELEAELAEDAD
jgi:hypothetical protein